MRMPRKLYALHVTLGNATHRERPSESPKQNPCRLASTLSACWKHICAGFSAGASLTLEPRAVTKVVAERHGISTGLLYTWRQQMLTLLWQGLCRCRWHRKRRRRCWPPLPNRRLSRRKRPTQFPGGVIEVQWSSGVRVRVGSGVDVRLLRSVLAELNSR
jgi:transposase